MTGHFRAGGVDFLAGVGVVRWAGNFPGKDPGSREGNEKIKGMKTARSS